MSYRHTRSALAAAILATLASQSAQAVQTVEAAAPQVVVTATRFAEADPRVPANITVISREDIAASPSLGLPDLLKNAAGVEVRPLYGNMGLDAAIDLRGFGDTGTSNTLVLLDGRRLNPIDSGSISWSSIPLGNVERIEIIRGSGSVLYGDRASGGVINIVTDKNSKPQPSVAVTVGSFGYVGLDAAIGSASDSGRFTIAGHSADSDGWRRNGQANQQSISGRGAIKLGAEREAFVDYLFYQDGNGMPGYLNSAQYRDNPRQSRTPYDKQRRDGYLVRPGLAMSLSPTLALEVEVAADHEDYHGDNVSFASVFQRRRDMLSLTPRLRWNHGLGSMASQTVAGIDYYDGDVASRSTTYAAQGAKQQSSAFYLQNTTELNQALALTLGLRNQQVDQTAHQDAYIPFATPAMRGSADRSRSAYDLGLAYTSGNWRAYGKAGTTFRFATTDELFGYNPFTGNPVFAGDIKPQHGTVQEIGGSYSSAAISGRVSLYELELKDEIGYDSATFANVNLPGTRRQGLETEIEVPLGRSLKLKLSYAYTDATFREGANDGKTLPLVPRDNTALQLSWDAGVAGRYAAIVNAIGDRRYSGDFANAHGTLAGYTTLDLRADWDFKPWQITARVLNATDQRYAPFAGYSAFIADHYYYPADGRSVYLGARYAF